MKSPILVRKNSYIFLKNQALFLYLVKAQFPIKVIFVSTHPGLVLNWLFSKDFTQRRAPACVRFFSKYPYFSKKSGIFQSLTINDNQQIY